MDKKRDDSSIFRNNSAFLCIERHNVTLAARRFPSPHTAVNVAALVNTVLSEWNITHDVVHRILTDNGSNMVAAFKQYLSFFIFTLSCSCSFLPSYCWYNNNEVDLEEMEVEEIEDGLDKDNELNGDELLQEEAADFEECEDRHKAAFVGFQRTSCFCQTLQLVVKEFDNQKSQKRVLGTVRKIVSKVNKSYKATEMLISRAGKKLITDCPTRWSSTYLMLSRLLLVRDELTSVLDELQWDNLPTSYSKQIEKTVELLRPFAIYTQLVGSEVYL